MQAEPGELEFVFGEMLTVRDYGDHFMGRPISADESFPDMKVLPRCVKLLPATKGSGRVHARASCH